MMCKALGFVLSSLTVSLSIVSGAKFNCTSSSKYTVMESGKTVCFGAWMRKQSGPPHKSFISPFETCDKPAEIDSLLNSTKCPQGWYCGCCKDGNNCLDTLPIGKFKEGNSSDSIMCSAEHPTEVTVYKDRFCLGVFESNVKGVKLTGVKTYFVNTSVSTKPGECPIASEFDVSDHCPNGNYFKCCDDRKVNCVGDLKPEGALPCTSNNYFVCSADHKDKVIWPGSSACVAIFDKKAAGEKPSNVKVIDSYFGCEDIESEFSCATGKFFACCDDKQKFCVDEKLKSEDAIGCNQYVTCSSLHAPYKKMQHGKSVCFVLFVNNLKGTTGTVYVENYASCAEAEKKLDSICAGERYMYICCNDKNCLDSAKAEDSMACPFTDLTTPKTSGRIFSSNNLILLLVIACLITSTKQN